MFSRFAHHRFFTALIALMISVLVALPAAEAATCGSTFGPACLAMNIDGGDEDNQNAPDSENACFKGACQNAGCTLAKAQTISLCHRHAGAHIVVLTSDPLRSRVPEGLKRPPKA